jgi:hypothetical protein
MVKGIELFAGHFKGFEDSYILIGGAACDLWMQTQGLPFRATKDLDIVIVIEALNPEFIKNFGNSFTLPAIRPCNGVPAKKPCIGFQSPQIKSIPLCLNSLRKSRFLLNLKRNIPLHRFPQVTMHRVCQPYSWMKDTIAL